MKKIWITTGAVLSVVAPVSAVVAMSVKDKNKEEGTKVKKKKCFEKCQEELDKKMKEKKIEVEKEKNEKSLYGIDGFIYGKTREEAKRFLMKQVVWVAPSERYEDEEFIVVAAMNLKILGQSFVKIFEHKKEIEVWIDENIEEYVDGVAINNLGEKVNAIWNIYGQEKNSRPQYWWLNSNLYD